jgi:hypothetical protein
MLAAIAAVRSTDAAQTLLGFVRSEAASRASMAIGALTPYRHDETVRAALTEIARTHDDARVRQAVTAALAG